MKKGVKVKGISPECVRILKQLDKVGYLPKKIIKTLSISSKTFYKHFKVLKDQGLFDKVQGVTIGGDKVLGYETDRYRIHGVQVFYNLPVGTDKVKWKGNRGRVLSLKKISYDVIHWNGQEVQRFYWNKCDVRCYGNGIMIYAPQFLGANGSDAELKLLLWIKKIGKDLNKIFKVDFFKHNQLNMSIRKYEFAHLDDVGARELRKEGNRLYIDIDGELRFICDFSNARDEAEGVTPDYAQQDVKSWENYTKDLLTKDHLLPSEVKDMIGGLAQQNAFIIKENELLAQNIRSHLSVVKEMKSLVKVLKKNYKGES